MDNAEGRTLGALTMPMRDSLIVRKAGEVTLGGTVSVGSGAVKKDECRNTMEYQKRRRRMMEARADQKLNGWISLPKAMSTEDQEHHVGRVDIWSPLKGYTHLDPKIGDEMEQALERTKWTF
jgi:hypothetical protein